MRQERYVQLVSRLFLVLSTLLTMSLLGCKTAPDSFEGKGTVIHAIPSDVTAFLSRHLHYYRHPKLSELSPALVSEFYNRFDSSMHPSYLPGDFNDDGLLDYSFLFRIEEGKSALVVIQSGSEHPFDFYYFDLGLSFYDHYLHFDGTQLSCQTISGEGSTYKWDKKANNYKLLSGKPITDIHHRRGI